MSVMVLRDFLAVKRDEVAKQTASGLFLPGETDDKNVTGTVVAVGSGRVSVNGVIVPLEVKVGDKIAFNKNMAVELKDGGETVVILREDQVLAVLK
jgi:chaperonin GroES